MQEVADAVIEQQDHTVAHNKKFDRCTMLKEGFDNEHVYRITITPQCTLNLVTILHNDIWINKQKDSVTELALSAGGKYLLHTHDYLYFGYKGNVTIPSIDSVLWTLLPFCITISEV